MSVADWIRGGRTDMRQFPTDVQRLLAVGGIKRVSMYAGRIRNRRGQQTIRVRVPREAPDA